MASQTARTITVSIADDHNPMPLTDATPTTPADARLPCAPQRAKLRAPCQVRRLRFRVPTMDCAVEEAEIRRALEQHRRHPRADVSSSAQRTLAIDAPAASVEQARGRHPQSRLRPAAADEASRGGAAGHGQRVRRPRPRRRPGGRGAWRCALLLAIGAEVLGFFAPDTQVWKGVGPGARGRGDLAGRLRHLQEGPGRAAPRPAEHQRADERGRHRRLRDRPVARGGDGDGALRHRRADRSASGRPRAQRDQGPARAGARRSRRAPGRRHLARPCRSARCRSAPSCACARASACRWTAWSPRAAARSTRRRSPARASRSTRPSGDPVFAGTINETGELRVPGHRGWRPTRRSRASSTRSRRRRARARRRSASSTASPRSTRRRSSCSRWPWRCWRPGCSAGPGWTAIYKALVLLVIACPCALVISTPVTVVSGLAAAARRGILIKGGTYLEEARKLKAIALDKTGTITEGKPKLVDVEVLWRGADAAARRAHRRQPGRPLRPSGLAGDRRRAWRRTAARSTDFKALAGPRRARRRSTARATCSATTG